MRGGGAGGGLDLGVGRLGAAEADVVAGSGGEDHRFLRHQRQRAAEIGARKGRQRHPVQQDAAFLRIVEPLQKLQDRGLARARRADKGHRLSGPDVQADTVQRRDLGAGGIAEGHAFEGDLTPHRARQRGRRGRVLHGVGGLQDLDQTLGRAGGALHLSQVSDRAPTAPATRTA